MTDSAKWVEVWIDYEVEYTLIVRALLDGKFEIYDVAKKSIIALFDKYEDAKSWLCEDEYEPVIGRKSSNPDDFENDGYFNELSNRAMEVKSKFGDLELANGVRKWTREDVMMGFMGDVGDLAKLVMAHQNIREIPDKDAKLEHELADCLWAILVLARLYNVNLEKAFLNTMQDLEIILAKY